MAVKADISSSTDLFGKDVDDLQAGIQIIGDAIGGTLKYVEDYTAAGFDMSKGNHFIALHATADTGTTITVQVLGGLNPAATLDSDGIAILQLTGPSQKIRYVATKNGMSQTKVFTLTDVTFEEAE